MSDPFMKARGLFHEIFVIKNLQEIGLWTNILDLVMKEKNFSSKKIWFFTFHLLMKVKNRVCKFPKNFVLVPTPKLNYFWGIPSQKSPIFYLSPSPTIPQSYFWTILGNPRNSPNVSLFKTLILICMKKNLVTKLT